MVLMGLIADTLSQAMASTKSRPGARTSAKTLALRQVGQPNEAEHGHERGNRNV